MPKIAQLDERLTFHDWLEALQASAILYAMPTLEQVLRTGSATVTLTIEQTGQGGFEIRPKIAPCPA